MELTHKHCKDGIECTHDVLGKVATIKREAAGWYVFPYRFPPCDHGKTFKSLHAATAYATALAHEMWHDSPAWR
jgi:hypothetical protein